MLHRELLIVRATNQSGKIQLSRETVELPDCVRLQPDVECDPPRPIITETAEYEPLFQEIENEAELQAAHRLFEQIAVRTVGGETTKLNQYYRSVQQWLVQFFGSNIEISDIRSVVDHKNRSIDRWHGPARYRQTALYNGWVVAAMIFEEPFK